jgi:hypothetical protein
VVAQPKGKMAVVGAPKGLAIQIVPEGANFPPTAKACNITLRSIKFTAGLGRLFTKDHNWRFFKCLKALKFTCGGGMSYKFRAAAAKTSAYRQGEWSNEVVVAPQCQGKALSCRNIWKS